MQSDKMKYVTAKNKLRESECILGGLYHFKQMKWCKITYDNLNVVNKYLLKDNVMIGLLKNGCELVDDMIAKYETQVNDCEKAVYQFRRKIDRKYWDCEYYIELLFG